MTTVEKGATYWTPRGRLCRWEPLNGRPGEHRTWGYLLFTYVSIDDGRLLKDQFTLSPENVRLLRKVA